MAAEPVPGFAGCLTLAFVSVAAEESPRVFFSCCGRFLRQRTFPSGGTRPDHYCM